MSNVMRTLLFVVPFILVAWLHWVRSIQQQSISKPRSSLASRDTDRARLAISRRQRRRASAAQPQPEAAITPVVLTQQKGDFLAVEAAANAASAVTPTEGRIESPLAEMSSCPASRKPYHTLLTATAQVYQQWQCRVMYFQFKKIRAADPAGPCTEMTGFTRLVARGNADPDGLENEIPSYFVKEYTQRDYARFHGYRVINRPYSVVQFMQSVYYKQAVREDYLFIAETDHVMLQPLPNKASLGSPMAYIFNYMGPCVRRRPPARAPGKEFESRPLGHPVVDPVVDPVHSLRPRRLRLIMMMTPHAMASPRAHCMLSRVCSACAQQPGAFVDHQESLARGWRLGLSERTVHWTVTRPSSP